MLLTLRCRVGEDVRKMEYECSIDRLGVGPSSPTSRKGRMLRRGVDGLDGRGIFWRYQESRIVCWIVSPYQLEIWRRQLLHQREDENAMRRVAREILLHLQELYESKYERWLDPDRTQSHLISSYHDWSTPSLRRNIMQSCPIRELEFKQLQFYNNPGEKDRTK